MTLNIKHDVVRFVSEVANSVKPTEAIRQALLESRPAPGQGRQAAAEKPAGWGAECMAARAGQSREEDQILGGAEGC